MISQKEQKELNRTITLALESLAHLLCTCKPATHINAIHSSRILHIHPHTKKHIPHHSGHLYNWIYNNQLRITKQALATAINNYIAIFIGAYHTKSFGPKFFINLGHDDTNFIYKTIVHQLHNQTVVNATNNITRTFQIKNAPALFEFYLYDNDPWIRHGPETTLTKPYEQSEKYPAIGTYWSPQEPYYPVELGIPLKHCILHGQKWQPYGMLNVRNNTGSLRPCPHRDHLMASHHKLTKEWIFVYWDNWLNSAGIHGWETVNNGKSQVEIAIANKFIGVAQLYENAISAFKFSEPPQ